MPRMVPGVHGASRVAGEAAAPGVEPGGLLGLRLAEGFRTFLSAANALVCLGVLPILTFRRMVDWVVSPANSRWSTGGWTSAALRCSDQVLAPVVAPGARSFPSAAGQANPHITERAVFEGEGSAAWPYSERALWAFFCGMHVSPTSLPTSHTESSTEASSETGKVRAQTDGSPMLM